MTPRHGPRGRLRRALSAGHARPDRSWSRDETTGPGPRLRRGAHCSPGRGPPSARGGRDKLGDTLARRDTQRGRVDADGPREPPDRARSCAGGARASRRGWRRFPASITACCVSPGGETQSDARGASPRRPSLAPAPARSARPPHLHLGVMRTRIQGSGSRARTHAGDKQVRAVRSRAQRCAPPTRVPAEAGLQGGTPFLKSQGKAELAAGKS